MCFGYLFHFALLAHQVRIIMSGIAVIHFAAHQVEHAQEEGDEHRVIVVDAEFAVDIRHNLSGRFARCSFGAQQRAGDGHK